MSLLLQDTARARMPQPAANASAVNTLALPVFDATLELGLLGATGRLDVLGAIS